MDANARECKPNAMTSETLESLIEKYRDAARRHGSGKTVRTVNKAADEIATIHRELRERGSAALARLLPLLKDDDSSVRTWAAAHALTFAPTEAATVLKDLATAPGLIGISAEMTLREWRAGRLRFP